MVQKIIFFALFLVFPVLSWAQVNGDYRIQGVNSKYGAYIGQGWVRGQQIQRLIQWQSYTYEGKAVQSIWTGNLQGNSVEFSLKLSQVLTSFNGFAPTAEEFRRQRQVSWPLTSLKSLISFVTPEEGSYSETWQRTGDASVAPLWIDQRRAVEGIGNDSTWLVRVARWAGIDDVIGWYRSQPQAQVYKERPEFQAAKQYFIQDPTDADFYAENPGILRVENKTLNPLSLAEALMRRNAYAPTLAQKAQLFETQTSADHLNAAGLLELSVLNDKGVKVGRTPEYDAGLWTAMYGWAELMKAQTTKDPQALASFRRVLDGMLTLVEITGRSQEFARSLAVSPPQENLGGGWVQGVGKYAALKWRQGGNNDMIKGILLTLTLAHQVVGAQETELRARVLSVSRALLNLTAVKKSDFNSGLAHGLVALWSDDPSELENFSQAMVNFETTLGDATKIEAGIYAGGIADWSGIQLSMVSNLSQILLAQELQRSFAKTREAYLTTQPLKTAQVRMWKMQQAYEAAHRDFLTIMTFAFSPQARQDAGLAREARQALWTLREIPFPRHFGTAGVDLALNPDWSLSAWPRTPWKGMRGVHKLKPNLRFSDFAQSAYSYPLFEGLAWSSTYFWKDAPFYLSYASNPQIESFSSDYLLLYWAARSSGLVSVNE